MTMAQQQTPGPRSVSAHELYTLAELGRRLGMGRKTLARAQKDGLQTVAFGRMKYVRGQAVLDFFQDLEAKAS
jgi:hypothetical protein